jgi:uridine kinase
MTVAFTDPNLYDLKIYLYTDGETELMRRSIRDVSERGTDINYLENLMQSVEYNMNFLCIHIIEILI